jgi:hypothetical protein
MGTVKLDAGPVALVHLHGDVARGDRVRLSLHLDKASQGVIVALPTERTDAMEDDPLYAQPDRASALSAHSDHRRPRAGDAAADPCPAEGRRVACFRRARPNPGGAGPAATRSPRWIGASRSCRSTSTDTDSLQSLAGEIGGKTDILINTARFIRPGGVLGNDTVFARDEMEVNVLGLMRWRRSSARHGVAHRRRHQQRGGLRQYPVGACAVARSRNTARFAPRKRRPGRCRRRLRAEFLHSGLRMMNVYVGPTDDEWHQPLPPPKVRHRRWPVRSSTG